MTRRPSPSVQRRQREWNSLSDREQERQRALRRNRERFGIRQGEVTVTMAATGVGRSRILHSMPPAQNMSLDDFRRAERMLRRANVPEPYVEVRPRYSLYFMDVLQSFIPREDTVVKAVLKPDRTDRFVKSHPPEDGWRYTKPAFWYKNMQCCGVKELHGIQNYHELFCFNAAGTAIVKSEAIRVTPEDVIRLTQETLAGDWHERERPFLLFTDNHEDYKKGEQYAGQQLLEYIVKNKLGQVFRTGKKVNGNTLAKVELFTWVPDWKRLRKFNPEAAAEAA